MIEFITDPVIIAALLTTVMLSGLAYISIRKQ